MDFYLDRYKNFEMIEFECEVITPMFLSGANQSECELRAASIKGALRFWWRAIYGINYSNIVELKKAESDLFGSTEKKSKLKIQILQNPKFNKNNDKYKPLPHKENTNFTFPCFLPGNNNFKISLICNKNERTIFEHLFILLSFVGGLGRRARRGFGSFIINKIGNESFVINDNNILNAIFNYLCKVNSYKFDIDIMNKEIKLKNINIPNLSYPYVKYIKLGKEFENYNELLKEIGTASHQNNCDYTGYAGRRNVKNKLIQLTKRFASPLYVSSYKYNNEYYPIITQLNVAFDPSVVDIKKGDNKSENFVNLLISS